MPKLPSAVQQELPRGLRPFRFHGLDFDYRKDVEDVYADCPFCGREGKLGIEVASSKWQCFVCLARGNALEFVRKVWDESDRTTTDYGELQRDRKLLYPETLERWGVCRSIITGKWLVPAYGGGGKLVQLYQRTKITKGGQWVWALLPTPDLWEKGEGHKGLFGYRLFDTKKAVSYICEGPWDGMAWWEILGRCMASTDRQGSCEPTGNLGSSLLAGANVVAVPGAGVFNEEWLGWFAGSEVRLLYDCDQAHTVRDKVVLGAGYLGMKRAAKLLAGHRTPPERIQWLRWGSAATGEGEVPHCDAALPTGYDVRDELTRGDGTLNQGRASQTSDIARLDARSRGVARLLGLLAPLPQEWVEGRTAASVYGGGTQLELLPCTSWEELLGYWRLALRWQVQIEDALAVMMGLVVSTVQTGSQLFLQVIGNPGSAKTRLCDALLTNREHCTLLESLTGFHSGWKDHSGDDFSMLSRLNRKVMITPEADTMMSQPNIAEIMGQARRIFDGSSSKAYKNQKETQEYSGIRSPWIMAGTPSMLTNNQSRLGDRFIRVWIEQPAEDEMDAILDRVYHNAVDAVLQTSNGAPQSVIERKMGDAYRATGGYVQYLRNNAERKLNEVQVDEEQLRTLCKGLARYTSDLRARPDPETRDATRERASYKELPTRLLEQFTRLAYCMAVATGRGKVDAEVTRRIVKVAGDTAQGKTAEIVGTILQYGEQGVGSHALTIACDEEEHKLSVLLAFLRKIEVVEVYSNRNVRKDGTPGNRTQERWRATAKMRRLWQVVHGTSGGITA